MNVSTSRWAWRTQGTSLVSLTPTEADSRLDIEEQNRTDVNFWTKRTLTDGKEAFLLYGGAGEPSPPSGYGIVFSFR